jgi:hypothetical protein
MQILASYPVFIHSSCNLNFLQAAFPLAHPLQSGAGLGKLGRILIMYKINRCRGMGELHKKHLISLTMLYYDFNKIGCLEEDGPFRFKLRNRL